MKLILQVKYRGCDWQTVKYYSIERDSKEELEEEISARRKLTRHNTSYIELPEFHNTIDENYDTWEVLTLDEWFEINKENV